MIPPALELILELGVPLELARLMDENPTWDMIDEWRHDAAEWISTHGDVIGFGGKDAAKSTGMLITALAVLQLANGGVTFGKLHWCDPSGNPCADIHCTRAVA